MIGRATGLAVLGLAVLVAAAAAQGVKPNIVLVLTDDQDLELGSLDAMPHLQALLAAQGTTFGSFMVPLSLCCPARTTVLCGQLPHNHGVLTNTPPLGGFARAYGTGLEATTVAVRLQQQGYRTALLGKYLNGYPGDAAPTYVPPGWDEWYSPASGSPYSEYNYTLNENGTLVRHGHAESDYLTDVILGHAEGFIQRATAAGAPFFVYFATYAPHSPATPAPRHAAMFAGAQAPRPPSFNEADQSDKPAWLRSRGTLSASEVAQLDEEYRKRLQSLQAVDEAVAALVATLEAAGQLGNTYVFFTSDNGYHLGEHGLRAGKYTPYQTDIRVPLLVRGPGVPAGAVRNELTASIDLAATFLDVAGGELPVSLDGRSLGPLLRGEPTPASWRRTFLIEEFGSGEPTAASATEWVDPGSTVAVLEPPDLQEAAPSAVPIPTYAGYVTATYKYVEYVTGERELYVLDADPYELDNQATRVDDAVGAALAAHLGTLEGCAGTGCRAADGAVPPPLLDASLTWSPERPTSSTPVTFTAAATGTPPYEVTWDAGGTAATGAQATVTLRPGLHAVRLQVRDAIGATVVVTTQVQVAGQPRRHL